MLITIITLCQFQQTFAQTKSIIIKGQVLAPDSTIVKDYSIYIRSAKDSFLLAYKFITDKTPFEFLLSTDNTDSLLIIISYEGYIDKSELLNISDDKVKQLTIRFTNNDKMLPGVLVQSRSNWKSGDTTFYNVDRYKDGDELTLKDAIEKIPGFRIAYDGSLYYKSQKIETIRLDGAELFADKTNLLMRNIPAKLLETIQAIENQSESNVLRDFTLETSTIVNIGFKKNNFNIAIGSANFSAGLDTAFRYNFNPVVLSIYGKIKAGYIGQMNNLGETISYQDLASILNRAVFAARSNLLNGNVINRINEMDDSRYLRNQKWDNRLQLNIPYSRKINSQLEVNFLQDHLSQTGRSSSGFLLADTFLTRQTSFFNTEQPQIFNGRYKITFLPSSKTEINSTTNYFSDRTATGSIEDITQNKNYTLQNKYINRSNGVFGNVNIYSKINEYTAFKLSTDYSFSHYDQNGQSISPDWQSIFSLPGSQIDNGRINYSNNENLLKTELTYFRKKSGRNFNISFLFDYKNRKTEAVTFITSSQNSQLLDSISEGSGKGDYSIAEWSMALAKRLELKNFPLNLTVTFGWASVKINELFNQQARSIPLYQVLITQRKKISQHIEGNGSLQFGQKSPNIYNINYHFYPQSIYGYKRRAGDALPERSISANYTFQYFLSDKSIISFNTSYKHDFFSHLLYTKNNQILFYTRDSLAKRAANDLYLSTYFSSHKSKNKSIFINGSIGLNILQTWIVQNETPEKIYYTTLSSQVNVSKLYKKGEIEIKISPFYVHSNYEARVISKDFENQNVSLLYSLSGKLFFSKELRLTNNFSFYNPNLSDAKTYTFWNINCQKKFITQKINLQLSIHNILNQKEYYSINRTTPVNYSNLYYNLNLRTILISATYLL